MKGDYKMHTQEYRIKRVADLGSMVFEDDSNSSNVLHIDNNTWMGMGEPVLIKVAMVGLAYQVKSVQCSKCRGKGTIGMKASEYRTCKACKGSGRMSPKPVQ